MTEMCPTPEKPAPTPDRSTFDAEVCRHRSDLIQTGLRLTGSRAEAEDLVQEAVMRAWVFWSRFEPGTNSRAWMHRIVVNTFINSYRRRRREREILERIHAEPANPSVSVVQTEGLSDEVQAALDALPGDFRDVVVLVDIQDRSYRDAADAIGCPVGTVMSRLHRARKAMKRALGDYASCEGYRSAA